MAGITVPTFTNPDQVVEPTVSPSVRVDTSAPSGAFQAGLASPEVVAAGEKAMGSVQQAFQEQKDRADQLAHIQADTQLSQAQSQIQTAVSQMKGEDALGAETYAQAKWQDVTSKLQDGLTGQNQKLAFARSSSQRWDDLNKSVQIHMTNEQENFADQTYQSGMDQARNLMAQNAGDDNLISQQVDLQRQLMEGWADRKGVPLDSDIYKNKFTAETSASYLGVIHARLQSGMDDAADKFYQDHKDGMSEKDILNAESALDASKVVSESTQSFNDILQDRKTFMFSDGTLNLEKIRQKVMNDAKEDGVSDQRAMRVLSQVKAMGSEYNRDRYHQIAANEESFANEVVTARKNGQSMTDAMKLAPKWGHDPYDVAQKQQFIAKTYEAPSDTKTIIHEQLEEGIKDGVVETADLDHQFNQGNLTTEQYTNLKQLKYKTAADGTDATSKYYDGLIASKAKAAGIDQDSMPDFKFALGVQAQGKSPQERWQIAQDMLKSVPAEHWWQIFGGPLKYKQDAEAIEGRATAQGGIYQDIGYKQVQAISGGMTGTPFQRSANPEANLVAFTNALGLKPEDMKIGQPANNAVQSLQAKGKLVTPEAVQKVLSKYPDGNWR